MKKVLSTVIFSYCLCAQTIAQSDYQWLIMENKGKSGYSIPNNENIYDPNNPIKGECTLFSIAHPDINIPGAKNDLFVIYNDGNFYNSRYSENPLNPDLSSQNQINHNLRTIHGSNIQFLYLTNRYEGDDPPDLVRVAKGLSGQNTIPYEIGITTPAKAITTNHDVVKGDDITIILRGSDMSAGSVLTFNKVSRIDGSGMTTGTYFEPSNIFNGGSSCSNVPNIYNAVSGSITFPSGANNLPYVFVNVKPTSSLPLYYPDQPERNSKAYFELASIQGGDFSQVLTDTEFILAAHDPNFIELKGICNSGNAYYAKYHLEFRNDGPVPAERLSASFLVPPHLDRSCVSVSEWHAGGGQTREGKIVVTNRYIPVVVLDGSGAKVTQKREAMIKFVFPENSTLSPSYGKGSENSFGYIEFCIKINDRDARKIIQHSYRLHDPKVYFDNDPYRIEEFRNTLFQESIPADIRDKMGIQFGDCSCPCENVMTEEVRLPKAPRIDILY